MIPAAEVWDVVVVGGGVAGLTAAHRLASRGEHVLVVEAADRCGGPVRGADLVRADGARLAVDVGAESFASRGAAVGALAGELGLAVVEPSGRSAWIHAGSRDVPIPAAGVLGIPADPWAADVRRAIGLTGALRASLDRAPWRRATRTVTGSSSLDALVRSRYGSRVADRLVAPVASGVHSAPLDVLDVDAVAPGLRAALAREGTLGRAVASLRAKAPAGSAVRGIDGGVHRLVGALEAAVRERGDVRTGTRVVGLGRGENDLWDVTTDGPEPGTVRARRVVVAAPGVTDPLLGPTPARPAGTDVHLVTLLLRAPALDAAPRGTGVLVAPDDRYPHRAKALTHATAKWPWLAGRVHDVFGEARHVVRLSYGRMGVPTVPPSIDGAVEDAAALLGVALRPADVEASLVTRWDGTLPPPTPDYRAAVTAYAAAARDVDGLTVTGGWVAGTGLAAVVGHAETAVSPR